MWYLYVALAVYVVLVIGHTMARLGGYMTREQYLAGFLYHAVIAILWPVGIPAAFILIWRSRIKK